MEPALVVAVSVCTLGVFVVGVFFGAYLQRKVYLRSNLVPPSLPKRRAKASMEDQSSGGTYQNPLKGYDR